MAGNCGVFVELLREVNILYPSSLFPPPLPSVILKHTNFVFSPSQRFQRLPNALQTPWNNIAPFMEPYCHIRVFKLRLTIWPHEWSQIVVIRSLIV